MNKNNQKIEKVIGEQVKLSKIIKNLRERGFTEVILKNPQTGEERVIPLDK